MDEDDLAFERDTPESRRLRGVDAFGPIRQIYEDDTQRLEGVLFWRAIRQPNDLFSKLLRADPTPFVKEPPLAMTKVLIAEGVVNRETVVVYYRRKREERRREAEGNLFHRRSRGLGSAPHPA